MQGIPSSNDDESYPFDYFTAATVSQVFADMWHRTEDLYPDLKLRCNRDCSKPGEIMRNLSVVRCPNPTKGCHLFYSNVEFHLINDLQDKVSRDVMTPYEAASVYYATFYLNRHSK